MIGKTIREAKDARLSPTSRDRGHVVCARAKAEGSSDVLELDGKDLRPLPLRQRRRVLERLV